MTIFNFQLSFKREKIFSGFRPTLNSGLNWCITVVILTDWKTVQLVS